MAASSRRIDIDLCLVSLTNSTNNLSFVSHKIKVCVLFIFVSVEAGVNFEYFEK
jgi:hypothetical protein